MKNLFTNYTLKDWVLVFLRGFIGALFIFSGFVKLLPIEPFELKFIELGVANWAIAPFLARLLISAELLLGAMLILNIKPRFTSISILVTLIVFTVYLGYDVLKNGNDGNCGCFGTIIVMTPLESIIKNLLMIPLVGAIVLMNQKEFRFKTSVFVAILISTSIITPFVLYPLDSLDFHEYANTEKVAYPFPVESIPDFTINGTKVDLTKGEYILPFMSVGCIHCKAAAYKLHIISLDTKLPPIYMVLLGTEEFVPKFIKETKADFPYYLFNENGFFKIAGNSIPKIFYIKNGIVKAKFDALSLTKEELDKALNNNQ